MSDSKPVAVVTGASRGAGAGIAHALGSHGCTVYVTGRTETPGESALPGTIHETAQRVTSAGGTGIAIRVDHADDDQVRALFEKVEREQGRLDILVNNAAIIRDEMMGRTKFWEEPLSVVDTLNVGLRNSYDSIASAAPRCCRRARAWRSSRRPPVRCTMPSARLTGYRRPAQTNGRGYGGGFQGRRNRIALDLDGVVAD